MSISKNLQGQIKESNPASDPDEPIKDLLTVDGFVAPDYEKGSFNSRIRQAYQRGLERGKAERNGQ